MDSSYKLKDYHFELPEHCIAQEPASKRDSSRLLHLNATSGLQRDLCFEDILTFFHPGDLIVVNDTKVFPARVYGRKKTGGHVELLCLEFPRDIHRIETIHEQENGGLLKSAEAICLVKSSKRPRPGAQIIINRNLEAEVKELLQDGKVLVRFHYTGDIETLLADCGETPLPPYIRRTSPSPDDGNRYQTVYAQETGAVAAPTAGLHFSNELLARIQQKGVRLATITLHVGYGTFAPVRTDDIREHRIHAEHTVISEQTAESINKTRALGGTIWTVGTTTTRALEFAADNNGEVHEFRGECDLYIYPGHRFKVVKNLITNFHLPGSSLLFMVSALAGRENIMQCYQHAISHNYRFYSYGDAMVITL
ncbi:MAG: tRNA preQ1(34) S-adenosylmethionine ribosyltransferase-isomerase QueA [Desulfobulbaceae bacterium]|nr:tRNA preQ1(34) S-adenosylmethionine ribosyltransferase-isomerase QueA [Desulfobulbaceae bacterium]